jgi:hypothetical protein
MELKFAWIEGVIYEIVDAAISTDFPRGNPRIALAELKQKFEPNNGAMKVQMNSEFQKFEHDTSEDDPDPWITEVEDPTV